MSDWKEGVVDVSEELLSQELLGQVIDEDRSFYDRLWIGGGLLSLLLIAVVSWAYLYSQRTPEQEMQEKLRNRQELSFLLSRASRTLRLPLVNTRQLKEAVDDIIFVSKTQLREAGMGQAPFIPERNVAIIEALEALLRLEIEGGLNLDDPRDQDYLKDKLHQLGVLELEYYENGHLQSLPLSRAEWILDEIARESEGIEDEPSPLITNLRSEYEQAREKESGTLVGYALMLGKWYRFQNDHNDAERCFDIGRRYIEGYSRTGETFEGKRPREINPLWHEYCEILLALVDKAVSEQQYRTARSFLGRIFKTPDNTDIFSKHFLLTKRYQKREAAIRKLEEDLDKLKIAIKNPLQLPSFPYYQIEANTLTAEALLEFTSSPGADADEEGSKWLKAKLKEGLGDSDDPVGPLLAQLNKLLEEPKLSQYITAPSSVIPEPLEALYKKSQSDSLSASQLLSLNRWLLDYALDGASRAPPLLSDGTPLSSTLNSSQTHLLAGVWEERISSPYSSAEEKNELRRKVGALLRGELRPSLKDLDGALQEEISGIQDAMLKEEAIVEEEDEKLKQIRQEIAALENQALLDTQGLTQLQVLQDQALKKQSAAHQDLQELEAQLTQARDEIRELYAPLNNRFEELTASHNTLLEQHRDHERAAQQHELLITQIQHQIELREQYLKLLKGFRRSNQDETLRSLTLRQQKLAKEIQDLRERLQRTQGPAKNSILLTLSDCEDEQHTLLDQFNTIYKPLRDLAKQIAQEEHRIWSATRFLQNTRQEINQLIGEKGKEGLLGELARRREELLWAQLQSEQPLQVDDEIRQLNEEIQQSHTQLSVLLHQEAGAKEMIEVFHPNFADQEVFFIESGELAPIHTYLENQETLMDEYQRLWKLNEINRNISTQEQLILSNLKSLSSILGVENLAKESNLQNLGRLAQNLLQAKRDLHRNRRLLESLSSPKASIDPVDGLGTRGYELDSLEAYQLEHQMGIHLSEFLKTFEERKVLANEVHQAFREKASLQKERRLASRNRDQVAIDLLIPKIAEVEAKIFHLTEQNASINQHLQALTDDYAAHLDQLNTYREHIQPQFTEVHSQLTAINEKLVENNRSLQNLSEKIFDTSSQIQNNLTQINIEDLGDIDKLITQQEKELKHLHKIFQLKEQENYYKAKALWLTAETLFDESHASSYDELLGYNTITNDMREGEKRQAIFTYAEYDPKGLYGEDRFIDVVDMDNNRANYETWVDHLEQTALHLFQEQIPQYTVFTPEMDESLPEQKDRIRDIRAIIANSRYKAGETYMKRAIRYVHINRSPVVENQQAMRELTRASDAFIHLLEFAAPYHYQEGSEEGLSQRRRFAQEFPENSREPVELVQQARVFLGCIAFLQTEYHQAIEHLRKLVGDITRDMASSSTSAMAPSTAELDPMLLDQCEYPTDVCPLYSSLLANSPIAHEALYRLGKCYSRLAEEEKQLVITDSFPYQERSQLHQERFELYANRAISYFSQLILTHSYSPYRQAALLQRAMNQKALGLLHGARNDLVSILTDPYQQGGSWSLADMTSKGDLPGELLPGYSHIAFELGKLHLESGDYVAAADAFFKAKEGDPDDTFVIQAKIAYAQTLMESKNWTMAHLLLSELVEERASVAPEIETYYHPDLIIDLGLVNKEMGNYVEAVKVLQQVFAFAPMELRQGKDINLDNPYGLSLLQQDFRDAIRPLALTCLHLADISVIQRRYEEADSYYDKAISLFGLVPWQEDRILRHRKRDDFESYRDEHLLLCQWGKHKASVSELLYSAFIPFRNQLDTARRRGEVLPPTELVQTLDSGIEAALSFEESFRQSATILREFYEQEQSHLPETRELRAIEERRLIDRQQGGEKALRYHALEQLRVEAIAANFSDPQEVVSYLFEYFPHDSYEESLLNEFSLLYAQELELSPEALKAARSGRSDTENLLDVAGSAEALSTYRSRLIQWAESEMSKTGLDDLFIAVSPQSKILQEINLYRMSLLAHLEDADSYDELTQIVDQYLKSAGQNSQRIASPEQLWQMVEIAATAAEFQVDWPKVAEYNAFLLKEPSGGFFIEKDQSDRYRAEIALATALLKNADQTLGDIVFMLDEEEKLQKRQAAESWNRQAKEILEKLDGLTSLETAAIATKTMAKEMLQRL